MKPGSTISAPGCVARSTRGKSGSALAAGGGARRGKPGSTISAPGDVARSTRGKSDFSPTTGGDVHTRKPGFTIPAPGYEDQSTRGKSGSTVATIDGCVHRKKLCCTTAATIGGMSRIILR